MTAITVWEPLTREEAEYHTAQAKYHVDKLREHIYVIHERRGWQALDYPSFEAWAEGELQQGYKWALKLKKAFEIQMELEAGSPRGEGEPAHLPTKHAEQLGKLSDTPTRQAAYQTAINLAEAEGTIVATRHVKKAVDNKLNEQRVRASDYKIVQHMMDSGDVSVTVAAKMVAHLDKLTPQRKSFVFGIMGTHGLTSAPLIPRLAQLADRPDSKMLPEIRTGYLNGKLLAEANLTDWEAAAEEARREHLAEKQAEMEDRQQIEARVVTVYRTRSPQADAHATAQRTLTALKRELTDRDIQALKEILTHHEDHNIREAVATVG